MRLHGYRVPLLAGVAALGVAGCGTSAPVSKPAVNVAITAPTSGATVGVRELTVTGTVTPATARVLVAGQPATVQGGSFRRTLRLDGSAQTVTVTAQAPGYAPAQANTQVSYSAGLAAQLVAASRALAAPGPSAAPSAPSPPSASLLAQAVALPKAAPAARQTTPTNGTGSTPTHSSTGSTPTQSSTGSAPSASKPTAPTPGPATPTPAPVPPGPSPSPAPVTTPAPAPIPPSPAEIAAHVKQQWESNCLQKQHGAKEVPYCTCIYTHLVQTGAFKTPASVKALVRRVNHYIRTGDASHITRAIMRALSRCQARFPASQSLGGRMSVTPLSSSPHQPAAPAPITPLPTGPRPTPISPNLGTWR